jgi:acyl-CoA thioester hydrolase
MSQSERPRPFEISQPITIRGYDIDLAGIVSNIVYIRWLEDLRTRILEVYFPIERQIALGFLPVLASTSIDYRRPLRFGDEPVGTVWASAFTKARWTLQTAIKLGERVVAEATQTGYFVDLKSYRPSPIPAELRERFEQFPAG